MGAEEEGKHSKPSEAPTSTQESPMMMSYPAWSSQMQAYYGPGISAQFYAPVQSQHTPPFSWGQARLIAPFGTSVPYPAAAYPAAGIYAHPNMTLTPNTPPHNAGAEGTFPNGKDCSSSKKSKESNGEAAESAKATSASGNEGASQSVESGTDGSLDASDENTDQQDFAANKKGSFEQMLADGANAQINGNNSSVPGHPAVSMPATNLNISMDIWSTSPAGGASKARPSSSVSLGTDPTNERELKREKRKQSNRESARRSRLRKQQECEELQKRVDLLGDENNTLREELQRLSEECQNLTDENKSIKEELIQICGPEAIAKLEVKNCRQELGAGKGDS